VSDLDAADAGTDGVAWAEVAPGVDGVAVDGVAADVDLLIVGAGPSGLYGGYYAGFRGMRIAFVDMLEQAGGQISALYPEKRIFDVAGFPEILGRDLVSRLVEQVEPFHPSWFLGVRAETITRVGERWRVELADGRQILASAIVITSGVGAFSPRQLPTGSEYEGRGLMYFVPKPMELSGKHVVIVGGGDSAFDWAMMIEPIARSTTLIHRRDTFRAHEHSVRTVMSSQVRIITKAELAAVGGEDNISHVDVKTSDGSIERLATDHIVAALGFVVQPGPIATWGVTMAGRQIAVDTRMQTNLPGVFAAGDITEYPGKVRLISVGFGEAATAINNAAAVIDPGQPVFPGHSSEGPPPEHQPGS
jgi:ferredoxin/flavodoxin---NADP+ reductase